MKIKINSEIIAALEPCKDRHDNWIAHYKDFDGDILDFLELENITATDKVWVSVRVMPRFLVEVFAIDCAFSAAAAAYAADYADYAADAASYVAADAAAYAARDAAYAAAAWADAAAYAAADAADDDAWDAERENQVDALIMLIEGGSE